MRALRFYLADSAGNLRSPFMRGEGPVMRRGRETVTGSTSQPKEGLRLLLGADGRLRKDTAPHTGASVIIRADPRYSVFSLDGLLGDWEELDPASWPEASPRDRLKLRDRQEEMERSMPESLRKFLKTYGRGARDRVMDAARKEFPGTDPEEAEVNVTLPPGADSRAFRSTGGWGWQGLADGLLDILMMMGNRPPEGQSLQLWKVDVPEGGFVTADDVNKGGATSFRDFPQDVPARRMTPVAPVGSEDLNAFIRGYNRIVTDTPGWARREEEARNLVSRYLREDPDAIPSDALCKDIYRDLSGDVRSYRERARNKRLARAVGGTL